MTTHPALMTLVLFGLGCAPMSEPAFSPGDAGSADGGLWPVEGASSLQFTQSAPYFGNVHCDLDGGTVAQGDSFHLSLADGALASTICDSAGYRTGHRVLSSDELGLVDHALRGVVASSAFGPCDGPEYSLTTATPAGPVNWRDVACGAPSPPMTVGTQGLEAVFGVLEGLSP